MKEIKEVKRLSSILMIIMAITVILNTLYTFFLFFTEKPFLAIIGLSCSCLFSICLALFMKLLNHILDYYIKHEVSAK